VTTGASLEGMIGAVASPMSFFHSNFYNLYHLPIVHIYYIIYEILPLLYIKGFSPELFRDAIVCP